MDVQKYMPSIIDTIQNAVRIRQLRTRPSREVLSDKATRIAWNTCLAWQKISVFAR